jgi:hypothetical protein
VSAQQFDGEGFSAFGLIWKYDYQARLWRYGEWSIGYDPQQGYLLNFPGGNVISLRSTNLWAAMNEAAYYVGRYNWKR